MKPSEILSRAKHLIEKPKHWTKLKYRVLLVNGKFAYCAMCALQEVYISRSSSFVEYTQCGLLLKSCLPVGEDIFHYNDEIASHQDILNLYDRAIHTARLDEEAQSQDGSA